MKRYAKKVLTIFLVCLLTAAMAVPVYAASTPEWETETVFTSNGVSCTIASYSYESPGRILGIRHRQMGVRAYNTKTGEIYYEAVCDYDHYFDYSQKTVEIKNMKRTVTIPNSFYNSYTGYKGAGTGAMDASMTLVEGSNIVFERVERCYYDGTSVRIS